MNTELYLSKYRIAANRRYLGILLAQVPIVIAVAAYNGVSLFAIVAMALAICVVPVLAVWQMPDTRVTAIILSVATMFTTALLIHAGKGGPEWHFHVFASLAILIMLADPFAILAAAGTIAVHHILFFFVAPSSLFDYQAAFPIVLLHAAFVVAETIPAAITARILARATMAEALATAQLSGQAETLHHHVDAICYSGQQLSQSSQAQAAAVEQSTASLHQQVDDIRSISVAAQQSGRLSSDSVESISESAKQMAALDQRISQLVSAGEAIKKIAATVQSFAFQTNLLALNAAVEAARAGEAGAGFAVVADEVRSLSLRSSEAARQTEDQVNLVLSETAGVRSLSLEVRKHLDQAVSSSGSVSSEIAVLAQKAQSQLQQLHSVQQAIQEISKISQDNAAAASSTNEAAQAIQTTNRSLRQTVADLVSLSNH